MLCILNMDALISRFSLSLLLLTSIATSAGSNQTSNEESREPRVSGRIVKLYSGAKPEPYLCPGEGFQADPSSCAAFYRCVKEKSGKFTVFRYQCAPGTVYDPDLETCNHPHSTRRTECGGMVKPTAEPQYTSNNNEIEGAQSELPRPISTKVPVYTEQTTVKAPTTVSWFFSTERQKSTEIPGTLYNTQSTVTTSTSKIPYSTTNNQWLYSTQQQWESQFTKITHAPDSKNTEPCTSDGFMGDSENCRKFYRCVGSQRGGYLKYEFSCSESTVWDDEIQGCNHPWAVKRSKCGRSMSYDDKPSSHMPGSSTETLNNNDLAYNDRNYGKKMNKTIQQQLQISHGSEVTQTQTQISNSHNVIQNQTQINYGNKLQKNTGSKSKQNQTQISNGSAVSQSQTQINYGNKGVQTQLQIDHSKDSSQSQVQIIDSTTHSITRSTQSNNNGKHECSESGFMGDANDCKKFYRCVNNGRGYTKYEYFCGEGTVWDPEIEACNHEWAVKECGGKYPENSSTVENHTTTTAASTNHHMEQTKTTPSHSSSHFPDTDYEENVGYGNQNNQDVTFSSSTTTKTTTTTMKTSTTTRKPNEVGTECTTSGFMGDVNDCKVFYRCVDNGNNGFIKYEFKCGDGTVWDSDIEACNHAWAVKNCGESTTSGVNVEQSTSKNEYPTTSGNIHTTVTLVQISTQAPTQNEDYDAGYGSQNSEFSSSTTSKSTQSQEQDNNNNNNNNICESSGFMGDKNDCKKFYRCVDSGSGSYIKYEFTCGQGTVWDPKIDACNHAWAVEKCGGNNVDENYSETSSQSSSTSSDDSNSLETTKPSKQTEKPTTVTSTTNSSTTGSSSSGTCSNSGFMGDVKDCKRFYRCVDNGDGSYTRYEFTCGEGTVWDPKIEACNHAWAVEKCGSPADSVPTHKPPQTTSQYTTMQDEEQENGYVTGNYHTSETSQNPPLMSSSTSATNSGAKEMCTQSGFIGDKNDCKKFYRCVDNGKGGFDKFEFNCGEGTVWDQSIEACNHARDVKGCAESAITTTQLQNETTTQSISSSYEDGETIKTTDKTTTTTDAQKESKPASDNKCKGEGFFGDVTDCKKFYRCVHNGNGGFTRYEFICGEGTSWNQEIQSCDHISSDKSCGKSTSQVVTTQQSTHLNDDVDHQSTTSSIATSVGENVVDNTQTSKKPQSTKSTCTSEGFYANPSNCKKFYRCVANNNGDYTKYDFNCGDGTIWNQEIQSCDHETSEKSCNNNTSPVPPTQTQATESQLDGTTSFSSTTKPTDKPHETTDKIEASDNLERFCTSDGFFAHPDDCKKFIRCVSNGNGGYTRYEFSCGDGTVWVQEIQACDHDNDINSCSAQSESASPSHSTTQAPHSEHNLSNTSTSSVASSTENASFNDEYDTQTSNEPSHDENSDCYSEGYFADKQDCRKFYRCVDNGKGGFTKYNFVCGEGTAWDNDLQTCNHINEVHSCSDSTSAGNGNHQTTTNNNLKETESTSSTTKATTASGSSESSNSKDTCESDGYFGNSQDCKKFYRCVDNGKGGYTKYDYTCGEGTIWDQDITTCNHPQDVSNPSCGSSQGSSDSSSTTSSTSSSQATTSTTENVNNSQSTTENSQQSSKKPASNVTCDKAGYYSNPDDCKKFYRCVDWDGDGKRFSVFHFECGEGTIWDPALDTCNHEDSVYPPRDCSQTQSQGVGGESTTSTTETSTTEQTTQESTSEQTTASQTTSENTTTEKSNESTTTQQSTTNEITTSQENTTSEPTTTQQPTSEKTTTQKLTTNEQTTTEQITTQHTTTSEQTTTETNSSQQSTSEQTTTEQTTTQQSTTPSDTITTQQTTASEQTTTQQTTTEMAATQQTTSEPTTTQAPGEQTTTEQTTTTEQITTEQATTSEQTTTQQSTTEQTTTQQSGESTTQELTTAEQTTSQQTTTSEQTTTTAQSTNTDQTTTEESSTNESTTSEQTTTTQESSTNESTTSEQTSATPESSTTESATSEQTTTTQESSTNESTTSEQTTTEESTATQTTTTEESNESTTEELTTTTAQNTEETLSTTDSFTEGTTEETTNPSTTQMSSTESDSTEESSSTTEESSPDKECPETEDDQYLLVCPTSFKRHPKYCNMFYQCTEDDETSEAKVATFKCPNNTIYDESKTQCVSEDKADKKCDGEIANKRRYKRLGSNYKEMIVADKTRHSCSSTGYFAFEKSSECSKGFLKCEKSKSGQIRGYVYQCPDGYVYWSISKRCERIESVRDCKRSINDWSGRWNIPVERKNVSS